jgi:RHS repeat-associated protein
MGYDADGQLTNWNAPSGTVGSAHYLYDNAGNRVLTNSVTASTTTDTIYFDGYTETVLSGGTTTTTKYYNANGVRIAVRVGAVLSYLLSDPLGSNAVALNSTGQVIAAQHYSPYGTVDYSWGTMPTSYGYTGQRLDSQTGLLYYGARYYDPIAERFVRADTVQGNSVGMDPYAYVSGDPETKTDPTGHKQVEDGSDDWSVITSDGNGGWTQFISQSDPVTHKVWVHTDYYNAQGYLFKSGDGHPLDHHHIDRCGLPPCDSNFNAEALAGVIVLNPEAEVTCAAAPELCILVFVGVGVVIIVSLVHPGSSAVGNGILFSTIKRTVDGQKIRVRKLSNREVHRLTTDWGTPFEEEKADQGYPANADIYVDQDGNYWIAAPGSDIITEFP